MTAQPGAVPQQQWMAKPQGIPSCLSGLEYLRVHFILYNCRYVYDSSAWCSASTAMDG